MLFLLRQIRRKMLEKNKITTYLLYAIGEIYLVVVGILIAVSIDGWNENQNEKKQELIFLQNILDDITNDVDIYDAFRERNKAIYVSIDSIIYFLKRSDRAAYATRSSYLARMLTTEWIRVHPIERTYTELKSSGQLKIIRNKRVSQQLSNYYNSIYKLNTYNDATLIWLESYLKAMSKVYDGEVLLEILKTQKPTTIKSPIIITEDYQDINELMTMAQYVYGAIKLAENISEERKVLAIKLKSAIYDAYQIK